MNHWRRIYLFCKGNRQEEAVMDQTISSISITNTLSKGSLDEQMSLTWSSVREAKDRGNDAITTERIEPGSLILNIYKVVSDPFFGGMGKVWCVLHTGWNVELAMKRPHPKFFSEGSDRRKAEFIRECEYWINLGLHPNIVSCYYVREIGGVPSIFSEWMDGGSLKDIICSGAIYEGSDDEIQKRILDIAIQTARGLAYAHGNGLIHQDVKPGNVLLSAAGNAKIADFGLAKAWSHMGTDSGAAGSSGYTPAYCPEEQQKGEEPGRWMDIYSWALTVLEMYAGHLLWKQGSDVPAHFADYIKQCRTALPESMQDLLKECITAKPDSFASVLENLEDIYRTVTGGIYPRQDMDSRAASADNLNNYALSMLDLRNEEAAKQALESAVRAYPDHTQAAINRAFFLWRKAQITDLEAAQILENLPNSDEKNYALKLFCLERGELIETEDGTLNTEIRFNKVNDSVFENSERIWLAYEKSVVCCNTMTGEKINVIFPGAAALALSEDRSLLYTGKTGTLWVVDLKGKCKDTRISIKTDEEEKFRLYPEQSRLLDGRPYELNRRISTKWDRMWLEENDTMLCVRECSEWDSSEDRKKFQKWERAQKSFFKIGASKAPPQIHRTSVSYILRFRLGPGPQAWLTEVRQAENYPAPEPTQGKAYIAKSVDNTLLGNKKLLVEASTGRVIRTFSGYHILSFSPDGTVYCCSELNGTVTICRIPSRITKNPLYGLSRIKNIETIIEENSRSQALQQGFQNALTGKDYRAAIRIFDEYRELPDRQDSESAIQMELALSRICRKKALHHYSTPSPEMSGFQMSVFDPGWVSFSYAYTDATKEWRFSSFPEGGLRDVDYSAASEKALELIRSKLPLPYTNENGEAATLEFAQKRFDFRLVNYDMNVVYAVISEDDNRSGFVTVRVDLSEKEVKVIAAMRGKPMEAPGGTRIAISGKPIYIQEKSGASFTVDVPCDQSFSIFSPDSDFLLFRSYRSEETGYKEVHMLVHVTPEAAGEAGSERQTFLLPLRPEPSGLKITSLKQVKFSSDGMHLMLINKGMVPDGKSGLTVSREVIPWLRLSWKYDY